MNKGIKESSIKRDKFIIVSNIEFIILLLFAFFLLWPKRELIYGKMAYSIQLLGIILGSLIVVIIGALRVVSDWPSFRKPHVYLEPVVNVILGVIAVFGIAFTILYGSLYSYAVSARDIFGYTNSLLREGMVLSIFIFLFFLNIVFSVLIPLMSKINYDVGNDDRTELHKQQVAVHSTHSQGHRNDKGILFVSVVFIAGMIILFNIFLPFLNQTPATGQQTSFIQCTQMKNYNDTARICDGLSNSRFSNRYITDIIFSSSIFSYKNVTLTIRDVSNTNITKVFFFRAINWSWSSLGGTPIVLPQNESLWASISYNSETDLARLNTTFFTVLGYNL